MYALKPLTSVHLECILRRALKRSRVSVLHREVSQPETQNQTRQLNKNSVLHREVIKQETQTRQVNKTSVAHREGLKQETQDEGHHLNRTLLSCPSPNSVADRTSPVDQKKFEDFSQPEAPVTGRVACPEQHRDRNKTSGSNSTSVDRGKTSGSNSTSVDRGKTSGNVSNSDVHQVRGISSNNALVASDTHKDLCKSSSNNISPDTHKDRGKNSSNSTNVVAIAPDSCDGGIDNGIEDMSEEEDESILDVLTKDLDKISDEYRVEPDVDKDELPALDCVSDDELPDQSIRNSNTLESIDSSEDDSDVGESTPDLTGAVGMTQGAVTYLCSRCDGDARVALNVLQSLISDARAVVGDREPLAKAPVASLTELHDKQEPIHRATSRAPTKTRKTNAGNRDEDRALRIANYGSNESQSERVVTYVKDEPSLNTDDISSDEDIDASKPHEKTSGVDLDNVSDVSDSSEHITKVEAVKPEDIGSDEALSSDDILDYDEIDDDVEIDHNNKIDTAKPTVPEFNQTTTNGARYRAHKKLGVNKTTEADRRRCEHPEGGVEYTDGGSDEGAEGIPTEGEKSRLRHDGRRLLSTITIRLVEAALKVRMSRMIFLVKIHLFLLEILAVLK